jgi:hypothetical protein
MSSPLLLLPALILLTACASRPPASPGNLCEIYRENPGWYADSVAAASRWDGPLDVPMAIMAQESGYRARAKPPMRFFLGFIPYGRGSDAYGYPQALDSTWSAYRREAGGIFSQRDDFSDAIDFIQWYMHRSWRLNGVAKSDAFGQYLNYHEGQGGYRRGTWRNKNWLIRVARRVEQRATRYRAQLAACRPQLEKRRKRWFW